MANQHGLPTSDSEKSKIDLYFYFVSNNQTDTNNIYFAPYPSGFASGIINYDQNVYIGYENGFGGFPAYDPLNLNSPTLNTAISSRATGILRRGPIEVDQYGGGLTGWLNDILYPAITDSVNASFLSPSTYTGRVILDYETWNTMWYYSASGATDLTTQWRAYCSNRYGPTTENEYRQRFLNVSIPLFTESVRKIKELMPLAKVGLYSKPINSYYLYTFPNIYSLDANGVRQMQNENAAIYNIVDEFHVESYANIAIAIENNDPPGTSKLAITTYAYYLKVTWQEYKRLSDLHSKPIIAWLHPLFPPGLSVVGNYVDEKTQDLIINSSRVGGAKGFLLWIATPALLGHGTINDCNSGIAIINKKMRYLNDSATGLYLPSYGYSPFWDSPLAAGV